jgi:hypothetical protein
LSPLIFIVCRIEQAPGPLGVPQTQTL